MQDGAALELWNGALDQVIFNIADPNTEAVKKREINLKVVVIPAEARDKVRMQVFCSTKLAPPKAFETEAFIQVKNGAAAAAEFKKPEQMNLPGVTGAKVTILADRAAAAWESKEE